jgi:hypothetical protein
MQCSSMDDCRDDNSRRARLRRARLINQDLPMDYLRINAAHEFYACPPSMIGSPQHIAWSSGADQRTTPDVMTPTVDCLPNSFNELWARS